jgi:flagellar motility protein MotE (MotC chaperone)
MKTGYDQFFKKAQKVAEKGRAKPIEKRKIQFTDSNAMAEELRVRMRPMLKEQQKKRKPKKSIPWKIVGFSLIGLLIAGLCLWKSDEIDRLARKVEVDFLGTAQAEEAKPVEKPKSNEPEKKEEAVAGKKEYSQEEIDHFAKLNERKKELDAREEELARTEQELQEQKAQLEKRMAELEQTRKNISSVLEDKVQADDKKVDNLVQVYSNMKPQQAAKAFEEMDEGLAIEILGRMKKKNAAEIMNLVKSEKVKVLSEKYAGYKRN